MCTSKFEALPSEIIVMILGKLDYDSQLNMIETCSRFFAEFCGSKILLDNFTLDLNRTTITEILCNVPFINVSIRKTRLKEINNFQSFRDLGHSRITKSIRKVTIECDDETTTTFKYDELTNFLVAMKNLEHVVLTGSETDGFFDEQIPVS